MKTITTSVHSRYIESVLEHAFLADLMRHLWSQQFGEELQVYRAEVDSLGFDLVLTFAGITRHVQFKSKGTASSTRHFPINQKLASVRGGCVILIIYDPYTLAIESYQFFGIGQGKNLPDISQLPRARHTRPDSKGIRGERASTRKLPLSFFHGTMKINEIALLLFHSRENG